MKKLTAALALVLVFLCASATTTSVRADEPPQDATKTVCITFDDGPTDSTTPKVLDVLKDEGVRATFFVVGRQINGREKILKRTDEEGHSIGIHTYTHNYRQIYADKDALMKDIRKCREEITRVLPLYHGMIYRFPGGSFLCPALRGAVTDAGYRYFDWNAAAGDAEGNYLADRLYENTVATSKGKKDIILLLHDGVGYSETVKALPRIIRYYKENDYEFKTL